MSSTILIIDDEEAIRDILQKSVQRAGYDCSVAATGEGGLKILEESDIDVVITDIQMPGIDGFEILNEVKEKYTSNVIVMTGFIEDYKYEQIIDKGANDILDEIRKQS